MADDDCPAPKFDYYISQICIFEHQEAITWILCAACALELVYCGYLFKKAGAKAHSIRHLGPYESIDATYCILSFYIVKLTQIFVLCIMAKIVINMLRMLFMGSYVEKFFTEE